MTRKEGFIKVDEILEEIGVDTTSLNTILNSQLITKEANIFSIVFSFFYQNQKYYYKCGPFASSYNELVCKELAKDYGYPYVDYDLATIKDKKGVISKNFKKENANYITGEELLSDFYKDEPFIDRHNNLEDIWDALEYRYRNHPNKRQIVEYLMERIVGIFIFDIIICQNDRHPSNWGIEESENKIDIMPLYDNEKCLSTNQKNTVVALTMDTSFVSDLLNTLESFESVSSKKYTDLLNEKIWIISEENLESIFKRIENQTSYPMPDSIKDYYQNEFSIHRNRLLTREENIRKR